MTYRRRFYLRRQLDHMLRKSGLRITGTRKGTGFPNHSYYLAERV